MSRIFGTLCESFLLSVSSHCNIIATIGGNIFRFAPSFLRGALDLLCCAGVCELLVAKCLADLLLDGA